MVRISHIVAMANNRVIGYQNQLPWYIKGELAWFKKNSLHKPVIMGRKTWESLPKKPLPERDNIILTKNRDYKAKGALICHSWQAAYELAQKKAQDEITIIGGSELFIYSLPFINKLYLTHIDAEPQGDAFYPDIDLSQWNMTYQAKGPYAEASSQYPQGYGCHFYIYERD